jgi:dTMP kinase
MSLLISFEGIDGSGKSTLINKVNEALKDSIVTREPRGTKLGYKIWELLNNSISEEKLIQGDWTNFFLFLAAHSENVTSVVKPGLAEGKTVIVDRYIDSIFAYQGLNKKLGIENVWKIMKSTVASPVPHFTFILDIDPAIAQERLNKRREETGEYTNFDSAEINFHEKIRVFFHKIKEMFPKRVHLIDANRTPDEVFASVMKIINNQPT